MVNQSILLIDDDILHLKNLKERIEDIFGPIVQTAHGYKAGVIALNSIQPDLILIDHFLDLGKTSIDFITENIKKGEIPIIVLTTFYNTKIFNDVVKMHPVDFIAKSCSDFDLEKSIKLALAKNKSNHLMNSKDALYLKVDKVIRRFDLNKLEMIEVDGKHLKLHLENTTYLIRSTLNEMNEKLPSNFIKIHQSFIVNRNFIEYINPETFKVQLKSCFAYVSRPYQKMIRNLNQF